MIYLAPKSGARFAFWSPVGDLRNFSFTMVSPQIDCVLRATHTYKSNKKIANIYYLRYFQAGIGVYGGRVFWGPSCSYILLNSRWNASVLPVFFWGLLLSKDNYCGQRPLLVHTGVCAYIGKSGFLPKSRILLFFRMDKSGRFEYFKMGSSYFMRLKLFLNRGCIRWYR